MNNHRIELVLDKIRQVFPSKDPQEILSILEDYGTEDWEHGKYRVYLAILKLCDEERLSDPTKYVKVAKQDYRDVLAWAEYPNQMKHGPTKDPKVRERLKRLDNQQYQAWLDKTQDFM